MKNLFIDAKINFHNYDIIFLTERFEKIVKQRQNFCLFFESSNSPMHLKKIFKQTMLRVYFNSLHDNFADFEDSYGLFVFYQKKFSSINIFSAAIAHELHNFFISNVDDEIFRYIYESCYMYICNIYFVPLKDYNSTCFKIVNKEYLNHFIAAKK